MLIDPDTSARLLEVGVAEAEGIELIAHAMPARAQVPGDLTAARAHGISRQRIGELLGTSARAAQQRYGAIVETGQPGRRNAGTRRCSARVGETVSAADVERFHPALG